jgi:hypothetical protein
MAFSMGWSPMAGVPAGVKHAPEAIAGDRVLHRRDSAKIFAKIPN